MTAPQPATPGSDSPTLGPRQHVWDEGAGTCIYCRITGTPGNIDAPCGQFTRPAAPSPVDTTEPPAETQQDDERWPDAVLIEGDWISPRKEAHARNLTKAWADAAKDAGCPPRFVARMRTFVELHDRLHAESVALAARPSADTETLLASVLRKLIADKHAFLSLSTHRSDSGMPVQFTLDDTTVGITDAEADAVKREAGW